MKPRNVPKANNPNCHANDNSIPAPIAASKQPTDKHAIANPYKLSTAKKYASDINTCKAIY